MVETRVCTTCGVEQSLQEFSRCGRYGRRKKCDSCRTDRTRERQRLWAKNNRPRVRAHQKRWEASNPEKVKAQRRRSRIKQRYDLTEAEYEAMVEAQRGLCAICGAKPDRLVIDHDHETGEVRGLLCKTCNHGIGFLKDDPIVVAAALAYLTKKGESQW